MPQYFYTAKNLNGEEKSGSIEAGSEKELARILRNEGSLLISASEDKKASNKGGSFLSKLNFLSRVSLVDKLMFTRNLKVMISAGVSLPQALRIMSNQTENKKFKAVMSGIEKDVVEGKVFSSALEKYPDIFPNFFISMVKAGEESGTLENILDVLTRHMEKDHELRSKIKGALVYPGVILSAMAVIGVLMMIIVVPQLAKTFEDLQLQLPITTRIIIALGQFLTNFWYLLPVIIIFFIFLFRFIFKMKAMKRALDFLFIKMPLVKNIVKKINSAYTARSLSSLISSGVPIVRSLNIVAGILDNSYFHHAIEETAIQVEKGEKLGQAFKKFEGIYPVLLVQMIGIGEETGETSAILDKLADFYEGEVDNFAKNFSSVIEPVLMIVIGAAVGFFAVSMLQPMYSMMNSL